MSLDTRKALPPFGRSRAGSRATAVTAAAAAASVLTACVLTACGSGPGSPPSDASPPAAASSPAAASRTLSETGSSLIGTTVAWPGQPAALGAAGSDVVNTSQSSATRAQDLRAFLTWAVTSGTAQLVKVNFQPLPPSTITLSDAQIARIKG